MIHITCPNGQANWFWDKIAMVLKATLLCIDSYIGFNLMFLGSDLLYIGRRGAQARSGMCGRARSKAGGFGKSWDVVGFAQGLQ